MLKIIKDTNPIMRNKSLPVEMPLTKEDKNILDEMLEYLKLSQDEEYIKKHKIRSGVGLAAVQIGILKRMFVIYYKNAKGNIIQYQLVNPKIIEESARKVALSSGEGCLSVDKDVEGLCHRHFKIKMKAFDALTNKEIEIVAREYDAIVLQHEYDHLDGLFYYDRINKMNPMMQEENELIL